MTGYGGNEIYLSNNSEIPDNISLLRRKIRMILLHSAKSLQQDLEGMDMVGNGFWEETENKLVKMIRES